jgi:glycosyltransferase involved in cell wall biosynthesis
MAELKVGYILKSFPVLSQTFVLNELATLQTLGVPFEIFSVLNPPPSPVEHQVTRSLLKYIIPWRQVRKPVTEVWLANLYLLACCGPRRYQRAHQLTEAGQFFHGWRAFARLAYWADYLRRRGVNHLHAHFGTEGASVARIFATLLQIPFSVTLHANDIFLPPPDLGEKLHEAAFIVTVSQYNKSYLLDTYPGLDPSKIHILHPWVDLSRFTPPTTRASDGVLRLLSVGRLVEKKGHRYLIEACQLLQAQSVDFECRIVGDGPLRPELEAVIAGYDLEERVHLLGALSHSEVLSLLAWCEVFALPCVIAGDGDRDGMPVALAEAMAMQVPVVSTDIVGIGELVRPGTGRLVPPRDPVALSEALQTIWAAGESDRALMGRRGRDVIAANFNLLEGTRELVSLFQRMGAD